MDPRMLGGGSSRNDGRNYEKRAERWEFPPPKKKIVNASQLFPNFFFCKGMDGVAASKNWKTCAFRVPPKWDEYIPKKNRHSESVPRCPGDSGVRPAHAAGWAPKVGPPKFFREPFWFPRKTIAGQFGGSQRGGFLLEQEKAYSTQCSQVVAHLSTNWA